MAANNPQATLIHRSPKKRDAVLHVPFAMEAELRDFSGSNYAEIGDALASIEGDPRTRKYMDQFRDWRLQVKTAGTSDATYVFGPQILPSDELEKDPSDSWIEVRNHPWPAVIRGQLQFYHFTAAGDYGGTRLVIDEARAASVPTEFLIEVWWTTQSWDQTDGGTKRGPNLKNWLQTNRPMPSPVEWKYPLLKGSRMALHEDIKIPPLSGITKMQGRTYANLNTPGVEFFATNQKTWTRHVYLDGEKKINGAFRRIRMTAIPPWDALRFPKAPKQYTS